MKKTVSFITLIVVVAVLAVTFAACNNATTQGQLVDAWKEGRPYECYTYSVDDSAQEGVEGEYVSEVFYYAAYNSVSNPDKVRVGDTYFEQREGYLIHSELNATLDGTVYEYVMECYFALTDGRNYLLPVATFRSEKVGDDEVSMNGTYSGNNLSYTLKTAGGEKKGNVELGSVYYDNNQFAQSLRGVSTFSSSLSFSFTTPVVNATEQVSASLTFSVGGTASVGDLPFASTGKDGDGNEVNNATTTLECYRATLGRATTVSGASQTYLYTVNPVYAAKSDDGTTTLLSTYDNGKMWSLPHVLVGFVEPYNDADGNAQTVTYSLTGISLVSRPSDAD